MEEIGLLEVRKIALLSDSHVRKGTVGTLPMLLDTVAGSDYASGLQCRCCGSCCAAMEIATNIARILGVHWNSLVFLRVSLLVVLACLAQLTVLNLIE